MHNYSFCKHYHSACRSIGSSNHRKVNKRKVLEAGHTERELWWTCGGSTGCAAPNSTVVHPLFLHKLFTPSIWQHTQYVRVLFKSDRGGTSILRVQCQLSWFNIRTVHFWSAYEYNNFLKLSNVIQYHVKYNNNYNHIIIIILENQVSLIIRSKSSILLICSSKISHKKVFVHNQHSTRVLFWIIKAGVFKFQGNNRPTSITLKANSNIACR